MTEKKGKSGTVDVKALLAGDEEFLRALVRTALQEVLEVEVAEALGAEPRWRISAPRHRRRDWRSLRSRVTRRALALWLSPAPPLRSKGADHAAAEQALRQRDLGGGWRGHRDFGAGRRPGFLRLRSLKRIASAGDHGSFPVELSQPVS